jgi:hypothetical protein
MTAVAYKIGGPNAAGPAAMRFSAGDVSRQRR